MTEVEQEEGAGHGAARWAPWWMYFVTIVGFNYLRQALVPFGTFPQVVDVVMAVVLGLAVFWCVTLVVRRIGRTEL